ncbi:hypothetical protein LXL04_021205 [Taraxacum kok-saghyz]
MSLTQTCTDEVSKISCSQACIDKMKHYREQHDLLIREVEDLSLGRYNTCVGGLNKGKYFTYQQDQRKFILWHNIVRITTNTNKNTHHPSPTLYSSVMEEQRTKPNRHLLAGDIRSSSRWVFAFFIEIERTGSQTLRIVSVFLQFMDLLLVGDMRSSKRSSVSCFTEATNHHYISFGGRQSSILELRSSFVSMNILLDWQSCFSKYAREVSVKECIRESRHPIESSSCWFRCVVDFSPCRAARKDEMPPDFNSESFKVFKQFPIECALDFPVIEVFASSQSVSGDDLICGSSSLSFAPAELHYRVFFLGVHSALGSSYEHRCSTKCSSQIQALEETEIKCIQGWVRTGCIRGLNQVRNTITYQKFGMRTESEVKRKEAEYSDLESDSGTNHAQVFLSEHGSAI